MTIINIQMYNLDNFQGSTVDVFKLNIKCLIKLELYLLTLLNSVGQNKRTYGEYGVEFFSQLIQIKIINRLLLRFENL